MYDTINLYMAQAEEEGTDFISEIPCFLPPDSCAEGAFTDGVRYVSGRVGNMYVKASEKGLYIGGSLCKYQLGNNFDTLKVQDAREAIERISDALHYDVNRMPVTRLDVATNIITEHPLSTYTRHFARLKGAKRFLMEQNVLYKAGNKSFDFEIYDKNKEHREKEPNVPVPKEYQGVNVARLEYRCRNRKYIANRFAKDNICASDICTIDIYNKSVELWGQMYDSIEKVERKVIVNGYSITNNDIITMKVKDITKVALMYLVNEKFGGVNEFCEATKTATKAGLISSVNASRLREAVKGAEQLDLQTLVENKELAEFDTKVKDVINRLVPF